MKLSQYAEKDSRAVELFCMPVFPPLTRKDRGTRFGWNYIVTFLQAQGRHIEAIFPTDTHDDLVNDCVSVITSMAARIYSRRNSKRRAEKMKQ